MSSVKNRFSRRGAESGENKSFSANSAPLREKSGFFRTIGARLTLWGAGITLLACLLLCVILYEGVKYSLLSEVDGFLEGEVHELIAMLDEHPGDYAGVEKAIRLELGSRSRRDLIFRVLDADGRLLVSSDPHDKLPPGWALRKHDALSARPFFKTVRPSAGLCDVRVCSLAISRPDGSVVAAQAAYQLDRMATSLAQFRRICGAALVVAVLIAALGGRLLAQRSLRPVARIIAKAQQITGQQPGDRLPRSGAGDELDRLAETLNDMLGRIERQFRQIQQFTADASHELRSPLAALRGNAEVALTKHRSHEQLRRVIEDSIEHYDRLTRIAEDLLFLARLDAGESILKRERTHLNRVVEDVVDLYGPLASERGLRLSHDQADPVWLNADPERLRQLVGNLLDNAVKYTSAPGEIAVSLSRDNGLACLQIRDSGAGIPAEDLPRVFDRFYRVDRARFAGGAGLGLAICRSIAEAHHGRIELASQIGHGTTVTVKLPLAGD